jgi:hypothetical protein
VFLPASSAPDITHAPFLAQEQANVRFCVLIRVSITMGTNSKEGESLPLNRAILAFRLLVAEGGRVEGMWQR